jgi:Uma2 family endonuclease
MIQALRQVVTFDEFIDGYLEHSTTHYELRRGVIVEMPKPKGKHSEVAGFVVKKLNNAIDEAQLPYIIPKECIVKISDDTGYEPDLIVLDHPVLVNEPRWSSASIIENGASIKLIVEVVSTNWRDDYAVKMADYESLGILEYWVVDYAGLGGRRFIGNPKQPTLSVCELVDGEYQITQFRGDERIYSPTFPDLALTAAQVFAAGM